MFLLAVLAGLGTAGVLIERTKIGKRFSAPVLIIAFGMIGAQLGLIPRQAGLYDQIWGIGVPLAIALFLIKADLVSVIRESGRLLIAFLLGTAGVVVGTMLGATLLDLGPNKAALTAVFSATYIGGSLNFAAVAEAVGFQEPSALASALAADNVMGTGFLLLLNALAAWPLFKTRYSWGAETLADAHQSSAAALSDDRPATEADLLASLAIAASACAVGQVAAQFLGLPGSTLLVTTLLMITVATLGRSVLGKIKGENILALGLLYLFLAIIGVGADLGAMLSEAPSLFYLIIFIFIGHSAVLLGLGAVFKLNYGELIIASVACILGPAPAAAIAVLFGWQKLVVPGILTGILGYAIGNFIGVGLFNFYS